MDNGNLGACRVLVYVDLAVGLLRFNAIATADI